MFMIYILTLYKYINRNTTLEINGNKIIQYLYVYINWLPTLVS